MKLFGEPISVNQLEVGKYYKFIYTRHLTHGHINCIGYGQVSEIGVQHITYYNGQYVILINRIIKIYPLNIELNKTYLFNINNIGMVEAEISSLDIDGKILLRENGVASYFHISEITGVYFTSAYEKIMYAIADRAARAADNIPELDPAAREAAAKNPVHDVYNSLLGSDINEYAGTGGMTKRGKKRR